MKKGVVITMSSETTGVVISKTIVQADTKEVEEKILAYLKENFPGLVITEK